jgi:ABC-type branched-subunit amino acid transport system substrate-binding protein
MSDLSRKAGHLIFHTDAGYDVQSNVLVDYILEQNATRKLVVVYQDDYGANVLKGIAEAKNATGSRSNGKPISVVPPICRSNREFDERRHTDVIIGGIVREPVTIMKTSQAMKYSPHFFGHAPTVDARVGLLAGDAGEGLHPAILLIFRI